MKKIIKNGAVALALLSVFSFTLAGCGTTNNAKPAKVQSTVSSTKVSDSAVQKDSDYNQYIVIEPGSKLGPDGKLHDAFINGDIKVTEGKQVTLHFLNYDGGTHTYTSAELGLNVKIKGSTKKGQPTETTYTFTPKKAGTFTWLCADPCDGENNQWAMSNNGYMMGKITVLPATNNVQYVSMVVNPGYKLGPDGKLHDAFTAANITVKAGEPVELTVYNFDDGTHTVTANDLGLNLKVTGSKQKGAPSVSTVTFTPNKAGTFKWFCADRCDGQNGQWAMSKDDYMMGSINVIE